jgi:hypothetical protein
MLENELGSYQKAMKSGGEARRGWEHKDPSYILDAQTRTTGKIVGGLLVFLTGMHALPAAVEKLDQLADIPSPAEAGLVITGVALLTYLGVKAGERIANYENNKYQS